MSCVHCGKVKWDSKERREVKKWELQSRFSTKMTQRMGAGFLTGRLMVNYVRFNGLLFQMPRNLDFIVISDFRSFNYWVYEVSNGCAGGQVKAETKELEAIYQGNCVFITFPTLLEKARDCMTNIFLKDSQLVQLVFKDSHHQESMVKVLEDKSGEKNFFLADSG